MHKSYLDSVGILDLILKETSSLPENWKMKERIDFILEENKRKCNCGQFAKPNSKWCGASCRNKDPEIRAKIGQINRNNKVERSLKMKRTLQAKYGVTAIQDIEEVKKKTREKKQSYYDKLTNETFKRYELDIKKFSEFGFLDGLCKQSSYAELSKNHFNSMPIMSIYRHFQRIGFDPKFQKSSSKGEREISNWLNSLFIEHKQNDRTIIKPKELDIVIPEKKLAIEYNGLYWHSNDPKAHKEKMELANLAGYELIQIFEDEWLFKHEIVKSIITNRLGLSQKIFARKTQISTIDNKTAKEFYEKTHIQGYVNGTHIGLIHLGKLVSCITIGKSRFENNQYELLRFSNELNLTVVGGFRKLLSHVKKELNLGRIITYSDLRYFKGSSYDAIGDYIKTTKPGYYWIDKKKGIRINRHATQKHKLKKLLGDSFISSCTEKENMMNNGYDRIWDCGHAKFIL